MSVADTPHSPIGGNFSWNFDMNIVYSTKHIAEVKNPRRIETHFRSPQLQLWQTSETTWLLALRQPERKSYTKQRGRPEVVQLPLPQLQDQWRDAAL